MANAQDTNLGGVSRDTPFEVAAISAIEKIDVPMTIAGSEGIPTCARKSASRTALPATNCAVTNPAHTIAASTTDGDSDCDELDTAATTPGGASDRSYHRIPATRRLHGLLAVLFGNLAGNPQPDTGQRDVEAGECGRAEAGRSGQAATNPADTTSPARVKNVSIAALALYFASRDVGRNSACRSVFWIE